MRLRTYGIFSICSITQSLSAYSIVYKIYSYVFCCDFVEEGWYIASSWTIQCVSRWNNDTYSDVSRIVYIVSLDFVIHFVFDVHFIGNSILHRVDHLLKAIAPKSSWPSPSRLLMYNVYLNVRIKENPFMENTKFHRFMRQSYEFYIPLLRIYS